MIIHSDFFFKSNFSELIKPREQNRENEKKMIEMSQPWEPPQLANFGHAIPHINFSLQLQSNDFQPYRATYQEVRSLFSSFPKRQFKDFFEFKP